MAPFAFLSIRLFAIFLVVEGLVDLGQLALVWPATGPEGERLLSPSTLFMPLVPPVAGIALWFVAAPLARAAQLPQSNSTDDMAIGIELWTRLVTVLFGLYLIATSIPGLAATVVRSLEQSAAVQDASIGELVFTDSASLYQLTFAGARLAIGLVLVIGRVGVYRFITFLRTFGSDKGRANQPGQADDAESGRR